ncbi:MAG: hypothetical protein U9N85_01665 [Bacteroidota bacterium]|nr:hypothetical protein [Bacteroidota bacterium]
MKDQINKELTRLQKELQGIESAVTQINKAESIASQVTKSVKEIQSKYIEHLDALKKQTKDILDKNSEASLKNIQTLTDSHQKEMAKTNKEIQALKTDIVDINKKNTDQIKQLSKETHQGNVELTSSHEKQMAEVNKLLANYLELAESTGKLSERISHVNFPERLDKITINTGEIQTQIRQLQNNMQALRADTRLNTLTKKLKKNTKRTNFVVLLGVLSFVMLLFTSYALFVKYMPQMDILKEFLQNK